jgi:hypothetical protein
MVVTIAIHMWLSTRTWLLAFSRERMYPVKRERTEETIPDSSMKWVDSLKCENLLRDPSISMINNKVKMPIGKCTSRG